MVSSGEELKHLLSETGNKLLEPPSSVDQLLPLLEKAENLLSRVEQSPPESIQDTLPSFVKALIADKLFDHSDEEVKVVVASCISEITRITAPDAPYEDDQMKDAFRLIVSSFEKLHDKSSRLYAKRTSILETVARVRSCVVMLDLECNDLILKMFQHFLNSIRESHPKNVFESMVTIMSLIIEESEDVSPDLVSCLLACVRKDKKDVLSISQALAEKVLKNCASTLKSIIGEVLQTLGSTLDEYGDVVRSICQDSAAVGMKHKHDIGEHKVDKHAASRVNPASQTPKPRKRNMLILKKEADSVSTKEGHHNQSSDNINRKRKGRQFNGSEISRKKGTKRLLGSDEEHDNGNADDDLRAEGMKKPIGKTLLKAEDRENLSTVSGSKNMCEVVGNQSKKRGRKKKRDDLKDSGDELEEISDSEAKAQLRSCTKVSAGHSTNGKSAIALKAGRNISNSSGEEQEKHGNSSLKKVIKSNSVGDASSIKKQKSKKQLSSEKELSERILEKSAVKEKKKIVSSSPRPFSKSSKDKQQASNTPKTNNMVKGTPGKKPSNVKVYEAELIGLPIRVWWPQDRQFYEGVVESFDSEKKKHKVVYTDGDEEILNLKKEKWEFVKEPTGSDQDEALDDGNASASPELPLKKRVKRGMEESAAKEGKKEMVSMKGSDPSSKGKSTALKAGQKIGVGSKSGGKSGQDSKNNSQEPPVQNGKGSDDASRNAYESDGGKEKAVDTDEPNDDDLLSLKASIKPKGRVGKTKKGSDASSQEDVSGIDDKPEKVEAEGLENQQDSASNVMEDSTKKEEADAKRDDEPNEDESSVPK
ncbi:hypothetical protein MLD38_013988 [Melastoma candidum]|uniref:Uncharacterized protein n=1 Tax=Melastoma candidum TaxID=119954 RepID=A0ACB9RBA3_9MYRT|nr:hypothetical protein MLD38_013988 [Melastoma candidum]